jgi:glycosyltransferase involved in cell wall biosynthesis
VLDLCLELRSLGVDVALACKPEEPSASNSLPRQAAARGFAPRTDFALNKLFNLRDNLGDIGRVRKACDDEGFDLVHVHFSHDHVIAGMGARRSSRGTRVIRTNEKAVALPRNPATRYLYRRLTDGYLTYSQAGLEADRASFTLAHAARIDPAMRLERFDAAVSREDVRPRFKLDREHFVLGVVARMQRHRRFDVLLKGIQLACTQVPELRAVVVGRGTHMDEVAVKPARELGLESIVTFTGYLGDAYVPTVAAFDALLFLVPGSDGTCRALREAMAMGKPVIGARRGMIPELVDDRSTGLVIDDSAENIASAIEWLARHRKEAAAMGAAGRSKALLTYTLRNQARQVLSAYEAVLSRPR